MPQALSFAKTSPHASEVIRLRDYNVSEVGEGRIIVKFLAMPINPLDLLVLAGKYPVQPRYTVDGEKIAGFDGVAQVEKCGSNVKELQPGDWVIARGLGLGTWRSHAALEPSDISKITPGLDVTFAGMLKTAVMPAYLLLEDMTKLKPGDWIILNAGTGVIAQMVAQFARLKGVHTISVIRNRKDSETADATIRALSQDGSVVVEERQLRDRAQMFAGKRVVLALDAVFGPAAEDIAACLSTHATFVNYGLLGDPSAVFPMSHQHIFWKQLTFKCFRMTQQLAQRSPEEIQDLYNWFGELYCAGHLKLPVVETVEWKVDQKDQEEGLQAALSRAQDGKVGSKKIVLVLKDAVKDAED